MVIARRSRPLHRGRVCLFITITISLALVAAGRSGAQAETSALPRAEVECVKAAGDPHATPQTLFKTCSAAAQLFRSMLKTATRSDQELIASNVALFEIYEAHAADEMHGVGSGDKLRANAKVLWNLVADHTTDAGVRDHARASIKCFFNNDQAACEKAFSASSNSY